MTRKFTDNAATTLATSILAGATTLNVATGKGDNFPAITGRGVAGSAPDNFVVTLENSAGAREKILCEHRAAGNDTLGSAGYPLVRGYDGTTPLPWTAGDVVDLRWDKSEAIDANDKVQAAAPGRAFGQKGSTTAGLTYGYYGDQLQVDGVITAVADGTVVLTASQTNYVERTAAGVVSANIVGFSADKIPMAQIVTDAGGITSITERRAAAPQFGMVSKSIAAGGAITLSADEARAPILELTGAPASAVTLNFPNLKRSWIVRGNWTGSFGVTAKVAGQPGVGITQGADALIYGNGTDIRDTTPRPSDFYLHE